MSDDTFRQSRKKINFDEVPETNPLDAIHSVQEAVSQEIGRNPAPAMSGEMPFEIKGTIPPEFQRVLRNMTEEPESFTAPPVNNFEDFERVRAQHEQAPMRRQPKMTAPVPVPDRQVKVQGSSELEDLLGRLAGQHQWEEFNFCSMGRFYQNIPPMVHIRPMTGEEEQILATPRFVKKGRAIDMIFDRCIKEKISTEELLSVDRTHLLIYLRGISYTPEYDVEIKCPECDCKFSTVINLDQLMVTPCPDDYDQSRLHGTLPTSGFRYEYRLAVGSDELEVTSYRERRIQMFGDQGEDLYKNYFHLF